MRSGSDVREQQRLAGVKARSDLTDYELEDLATAIENCVARDGQNAASANLPMGSYKHTGVATGSGAASRSEYVSGATLQDGAVWDAGSTGGTSTAFTATLSPAIAAYADKQLFRVKFNATFGSTPTINFNTVGAKKMYYMLGSTVTQLTTSNVPSGYHALLRYDTALDSAAGGFMLLNPPAELAASTLTSQIGALTAETTIATDDLIVITDTSESNAANKMAVSDFLKVVNALTEDTSPDSAADFLMTYDASASAAKKVKPDSIVAAVIATQANQETATSTATLVTPGRQHFHPSAAKAWVNFDGTAGSLSPAASYNTTSLTDNGTGDYTWTIATDFSSANWALGGWCRIAATNTGMLTGASGAGMAAGTVRVCTFSAGAAALVDANPVCLIGFGDHA